MLQLPGVALLSLAEEMIQRAAEEQLRGQASRSYFSRQRPAYPGRFFGQTLYCARQEPCEKHHDFESKNPWCLLLDVAPSIAEGLKVRDPLCAPRSFHQSSIRSVALMWHPHYHSAGAASLYRLALYDVHEGRDRSL